MFGEIKGVSSLLINQSLNSQVNNNGKNSRRDKNDHINDLKKWIQ